MAAKMGRPTDNPKVFQTRVRLTKDELEMLEDCARLLGTSKTDVVLRGIKEIYSKAIK